MTKELEERLALLEKELARSKAAKISPKRNLLPTKTILAIVISLVITIVIAIGCYKYFYDQASSINQLPSEVLSSLAFEAYYPSKLPEGFSYKAESANTSDGVLFFTVSSATKEVQFVEQSNPKTNLLLDSTVGLNPIDTPNGRAYVGKNKATPVAIIETNSTLINISGTPDVSEDVISSMVKSLQTVSK